MANIVWNINKSASAPEELWARGSTPWHRYMSPKKFSGYAPALLCGPPYFCSHFNYIIHVDLIISPEYMPVLYFNNHFINFLPQFHAFFSVSISKHSNCQFLLHCALLPVRNFGLGAQLLDTATCPLKIFLAMPLHCYVGRHISAPTSTTLYTLI